jgi:hypothetical protein
VILLRTDASSDGGQNVVFANLSGGAEEVADHDEFDEFFYLHADGAIVGASGLGAFQAAKGFLLSEFGTVAEIHFGEVVARCSAGCSGICWRGTLMRSFIGRGV